MAGLSLPDIKLPKLRLPFGKSQQLALGIDIGSHSVKICQMADSNDGYQLVSLGSALLPEGAVDEGTLQDPEAVTEAISSLIKNLKIKDKKVAISVSGYSVIVKKINLNIMSDSELDEYIQNEAGQYIPFDIQDVYLDYYRLDTNSSEDEDRADVMLVAAKKDVVDGYVEMLQGIGLQPIIVDVDGFALENIFESNYEPNQSVVLVDIGATKMGVNIISQGVSMLARDVVVGSRQLTEQIQNRIGLEFEDAEYLKLGLAPAEEFQADLENVFISTCTQWALEIKKAMDLYYTNNPDATLDKIVLSGGGSRIKGLCRFLYEETGIPVEILSPFSKINIDDTKIDPEYATYMAAEMAICTGLALRPALL